MTTYYVATRFRYVLVDACNESEARELARPLLYELYAGVRQRLGRDNSIDIHTIREATPGEIDLWQWHHDMLRAEEERTNNDGE